MTKASFHDKRKNVTYKGGSDVAITVNITGGVGPFTYQWNDSAITGNSLTNLKAGIYNLTVIDQNGCGTIADTTIIITEPSSVSVSLDVANRTNESCYGKSDASITITASGVGNLHYIWSTSDTTNPITNLAVGPYAVTISDSSSCLVYNTVVVQPIAIDTSISLNSNTITAHLSGAAYQWLNCADNSVITDSTGISFTPQLTGDYKVAITKDGCTDTSRCINIIIISGITPTESNFKIHVYPNTSHSGVFNVHSQSYGNYLAYFIVTDMLGKVIKREPVAASTLNHKIDLGNVSKGIYHLTVVFDDRITTQNIVIE